MKKQELDDSIAEIEKAREYLKDSQKNLDRLKSGKGVKRKFRFLLQENKILVILLSILLILSIVLPVVFLRPDQIIRDPMQEHVDTTLNLILTNFTDNTGLPIINETLQTPSSELLILSSLTYSLIAQAGFEYDQEDFQTKISQIINALENDTFVTYDNRSEPLPIFYQFLGIYTLLQSHLILEASSEIISSAMIQNVLVKTLDSYLSDEKFLIIQQIGNSSYLIDQALAIWVIATYKLLTGNSWVHGYNFDDLIQGLLDVVSELFFNSTSSMLYQEYDHSMNESRNYAVVEDLIFFTVALSRAERLYGHFGRSSSYFHQQIINNFVDTEWFVHSINASDEEVYIKNQAYFTMVSYLMNLGNVGIEVKNKITENFSLNKGFIEKIGEEDITCESCLYGLVALASKNWSIIENELELFDAQTQAASSPILIFITPFMMALIIKVWRRKIIVKRNW
ncbi:MAG: hypothetical protein ACTSQC_02330 [Candidatus Heimdallarchaeaceae archaeon]